jgi:hypothetical protein
MSTGLFAGRADQRRLAAVLSLSCEAPARACETARRDIGDPHQLYRAFRHPFVVLIL